MVLNRSVSEVSLLLKSPYIFKSQTNLHHTLHILYNPSLPDRLLQNSTGDLATIHFLQIKTSTFLHIPQFYSVCLFHCDAPQARARGKAMFMTNQLSMKF